MTFVRQAREQSKPQVPLSQDMTTELATADNQEVAYLNYTGIEQTGMKAAKTILARDYKGFGSGYIKSNGVIETDD